jgi:ligand-binding sensor domain-containing protein
MDSRHRITSARLRILALAVTVVACSTPAPAIVGDWELVRPDNTGIPGAEIRLMTFGPDDKLWVGTRWEFWEKGGLGIYDAPTETWDVIATVDTPIPSGYINDIEYAPGGVLWIATSHNELTEVDGGLVKKDGASWTIFNTSNSPLLHNGIRSIEQTADGHLWINNSDVREGPAALFEYDGASWRMFTVPDDIPWEAPWNVFGSLHVDSDDHVWVTNTVLPGVAEYDGLSWTIHGEDVNCFKSVTTDLEGNVWLIGCHLAYDVWKFDGTDFVLFGGGTPPLSQTTITRVACDPATGDIYIGNWMGEVVKTTDGGVTWSFFGQVSSFVTGIVFDPLSDDVWVGSHRAVHHLNGFGVWIESFNSPNTGFPDYFVDYMSTDRDGNFWVATGEAGLSRFDGLRWRNWGNHNLGSEEYPFAGNEPMGGAYQDRNGIIWMGGNGIARWDPITNEFTGFWNWKNNPGMGVTLFPFFAEDLSGELFAVDEYGVTFRFDGSLWIREPVDPYAVSGLPGVDTDSEGNVWICAWFALHKWDGSTWTTVGEEWPLFDLGGVNVFDIGPGDVFWLGTEEGLLRWDGTGDPVLYDMSNSPLPARAVKGVAVRDDGVIGLSTSEFGAVTPFPNGVAVIDGDINEPANWSIWRYEDSPIPHYQLGRVAFDADGDLWLSAISEAAAVLRLDEAVDVEPSVSVPPARLMLAQNRPNPFSPRTTIGFTLPESSQTRLAVFDVRGRLVRTLVDDVLGPGTHAVQFEATDLSSGVYYYRLSTGGANETRRMVHLR